MNSEMSKQSEYRAKLVRTLREQRSWTQEHLAVVTSLSERTIQRVESDGSAGKETLLALAGAFGIDVEALSTEPSRKSEKMPSVKLLKLMKNGKEILDLGIGSHMFQPSYPEPENTEIASLFGDFLTNLSDSLDVISEVGIQQRIEFGMEITEQIKNLDEKGYYVFGHLRKVQLKSQNDLNFSMVSTIFTIVIIEKINPLIVKTDTSTVLPMVFENGPIV